MSNIQVGQVWCDMDGRRFGRSFKIEAVLNDGRVLTKPVSGREKMTKIRIDRFKPWRYKLQNLSNVVANVAATAKSSVNLYGGISCSVPLSTTVPVVSSLGSLVDKCKEVITGDWKSEWPHIATLKQGYLGLVVRSIKDTAYDVKVMFDGMIIETWSSQHLDLKVVLEKLRDKLSEMRNDFSKVLD